MMLMNKIYWMNIAGFVFSHGMWMLVATIISIAIEIDYEWHGLWPRIMVNGSFWMGLLLLWVIIIIKDFYLLILKYYGFPSDVQILREVYMRRISNFFVSKFHFSLLCCSRNCTLSASTAFLCLIALMVLN